MVDDGEYIELPEEDEQAFLQLEKKFPRRDERRIEGIRRAPSEQ